MIGCKWGLSPKLIWQYSSQGISQTSWHANSARKASLPKGRVPSNSKGLWCVYIIFKNWKMKFQYRFRRTYVRTLQILEQLYYRVWIKSLQNPLYSVNSIFCPVLSSTGPWMIFPDDPKILSYPCLSYSQASFSIRMTHHLQSMILRLMLSFSYHMETPVNFKIRELFSSSKRVPVP